MAWCHAASNVAARLAAGGHCGESSSDTLRTGCPATLRDDRRRADAGFCCWAALQHAGDDHALAGLHAKRLGQFGR